MAGPVSTELLVADALADEYSDGPHPGGGAPDDASSVAGARFVCLSCATPAGAFFCPQCVVHGNFTAAGHPTGKRFSDRRLELIQVCQRRLEMANEFVGLSEQIHRLEDISRCVAHRRWRVQCLQERLSQQRTANDKMRARLAGEERAIDEENAQFDQLQLTCTDTKKRLLRDRAALVERQRDAKLLEIQIIKKRQTAVRHLVRDIFPLTELDANLQPVRSGADAAPAEYCRILEPILPLNGNYAAYHNYAGQALQPDVNVRNPLYEVPAGLGMVAQLLHGLVHILDFQMPDLVEYGHFLGPELDESSFQKAVYQLNWNILTVCSSQQIAVDELSLKETVGNLLKLIRWPQLGRTGPYDLSNVLVFTEDEPISDSGSMHTAEDGEPKSELLETEGSDETDWETIPAASASVLPAAGPHDALTRSTFGSAVSAVSALFRSTADYDHRRPK